MDSILRLTEGSLSPVACLEEGAAPCPKISTCRPFDLWQGLDKVISEYLGKYTIADLIQMGGPGNDYII